MEHLSCFLPGLFALGVHVLGEELSEAERELHLWAARGLGQTCWIMYADQGGKGGSGSGLDGSDAGRVTALAYVRSGGGVFFLPASEMGQPEPFHLRF